jgi:hypothetical protein
MSFDFSAVGGIGPVGAVGAGDLLGAAGVSPAAQGAGFPTSMQLPDPQFHAPSSNVLLDGLGALQIPDELFSGQPMSASALAQFNVDVLNWTTSVTAIGTLRKELNTAKTQLLSEGKS